MAKITVSVVGLHTIPSWFLKRFIQMVFFTLQKGHSLDFCFGRLHVVHWNKNKAVQAALEGKSDYVFFLDSDLLIPEDIIIKLLEKNQDIISGPYHFKNPPFFPHAYLERPDGGMDKAQILEKKIYEVDGIAGGCLLVKTSLFESIKFPYFKSIQANEPIIDEGINYRTDMDMSEDIYFSKKVKKAGFKIFYDNTIENISHLGGKATNDLFCRYLDEIKLVK